jgi:hypothetical protein
MFATTTEQTSKTNHNEESEQKESVGYKEKTRGDIAVVRRIVGKRRINC